MRCSCPDCENPRLRKSKPCPRQWSRPNCSIPSWRIFARAGVILFGSRARGDDGPDSDIDLLVVVDDDTPAEKVTLRAGIESRRSYHEPADVIPVREETFRRNARIAGTLSRAAVLDGVVVYERP